ncbi:MAG: TIGR01548 family HAD-type hydrolase [Synechococcaceae cyanobacterium]|nr:TIGR01548 family HAD-type hydrolase [Synechococcaceae cyanobacterium]
MSLRAILLLDIDGVIRDVSGSYRRAIIETVHHYAGRRPEAAAIDALKSEGCWNNDWHASLELLRRDGLGQPGRPVLPGFEALVAVFNGFYFGGDPDGDPAHWRGFIGDEPLLVDTAFFSALSQAGIAWGFVSGAEPPSARFVLQRRLGLNDPPLIAMGDAPDKPDPTGLLRLAGQLAGGLGAEAPPVAYLGDTVADVLTVMQARQRAPDQRFLALAVAPPHLQSDAAASRRFPYEAQLRQAGADAVIPATRHALAGLEQALKDQARVRASA